MPRANRSAPTPLADQLVGHRLLPDKQVTDLTGLTRRQRLKLEQAQRFPSPLRITNKIRLYPAADVLAWIERERAASHAARPGAARLPSGP